MPRPNDPRWKVAAAPGQANRDYKAKQRDIRNILQELDKQLERHAAEQKMNPTNYGHVGDIGHVYAQLWDIVNFLKGEG